MAVVVNSFTRFLRYSTFATIRISTGSPGAQFNLSDAFLALVIIFIVITIVHGGLQYFPAIGSHQIHNNDPNISKKMSAKLNILSGFTNFQSALTFATMAEQCNGTSTGQGAKFERLPTNVKPIHYDLRLKPNMGGDFKFSGSVKIEVKTLAEVNEIKFNANNLDITSAEFVPTQGESLKNLKAQTDAKTETCTVPLPKPLPQGTSGHLCMLFAGTHDNSMTGFYRSTYKDANGEEKVMLSTQFESTYARKAFPCWDEPAYKSTFSVALECPSNVTALSNMAVKHSEPTEGGNQLVTYDKTPLMSAYLVAFAVGDMHFVEDRTSDGVRVRVYVVGDKDKLKWCDFSMEVAKKSLAFYNSFFNIDYPLNKCDLIAIPDFSMGAMENWGLVRNFICPTRFVSSSPIHVELLFDPLKTSSQHKERIALVISHELAHMWFGNLTTMHWWSDLWLKEGFATFMEYICVAEHYPEFDIWMTFVNSEICRAFGLDALRNSHPIEIEIGNPNELDEIYDAITYSKATSILRMLYMFLGKDAFQKGIRDYLDKFKYANTEPRDLWDAFSRAAGGSDMAAMMSTWTQHMGFPLIKANMAQSPGEDKRVVKLTQSRFLADGSADDSGHKWQVPLTFSGGRSPATQLHKALMSDASAELTVDNVKADEWLKLNYSMAGYYRVQYDDASMKLMLPSLADGSMPVVDRFNLLNDTFALVRAGLCGADTFLDMVLAVHKNECDLLMWQEIDAGMSALLNVMRRAPEGPKLEERLQKLVHSVYSPLAEKLGWEPKEAHRTGTLRGRILSRLGLTGHPATLDMARKLFKQRVQEDKPIAGNLMKSVLHSVARHDGPSAFGDLCKLLEGSSFPEEQRQCILALGASKDTEVINDALLYAMNSGYVRPQDLCYALVGAASTMVGQDILWPFFKGNWDALAKKFGDPSKNLFISSLQICSEYHSAETVALDVEKFVSPHTEKHSCLLRPMRQSVEEIRLNKKLMENNHKVVTQWLDKNGF